MEEDSSSPVGFRFYPTEEELLSFYLHNRLEGKIEKYNRVIHRVVPELDIYDFNPWDLPKLSGDLCRGDTEPWLFFVPMQDREARGRRPKRLTTAGYWKANGSPSCVFSLDNRIIGVKRPMDFYSGTAPNGQRTNWRMHEYKALLDEEASSSMSPSVLPRVRKEISLCRVYNKSGCFQLFDRRPVGVRIDEVRALQPAVRADDDDEARTTYHRNPPAALEKRGSRGSSTFEDQQGASSHPTGGSTAMAMDDGPIWDWDHLYDLAL